MHFIDQKYRLADLVTKCDNKFFSSFCTEQALTFFKACKKLTNQTNYINWKWL